MYPLKKLHKYYKSLVIKENRGLICQVVITTQHSGVYPSEAFLYKHISYKVNDTHNILTLAF